MHKSMLWKSVLLVLFKGLCPSDYKWGICLTFKSWNIFRIHKVLTAYNTIGMFQEQLRVASIFTRCRPLCHALRSADEVLLRFYFALSTLMNQMIRKYCEGYSSSTGLTTIILLQNDWCKFKWNLTCAIFSVRNANDWSRNVVTRWLFKNLGGVSHCSSYLGPPRLMARGE